MRHEELCKGIIANVGGKENVVSVRHCMTRLRFKLHDTAKADTEAMKALAGVINVVDAGGEYQVVVGAEVDDIFKVLVKLGGFEAEAPLDVNEGDAKEKSDPVSRFLAMISQIFQPVLGVMMAAGAIKAILVVLKLTGVLPETDSTYVVLSAIGDAIFYFLPVAIGYTSARRFGMKPMYGIVLGCVLVYPTLVSLSSADPLYTLFQGTVFESNVQATLFGIPLVLRSYSSTVIPIILIVWFASKVFHFLTEHLPALIRSIGVPFITLLVSSCLGLAIIGPVAAIIQDCITQAVLFLIGINPGFAGLLLGTFWSIIVMFGLHWGVIPLFALNVATYGYDVINPLIFSGCLGSMGAMVGLIIRTKSAEERANVLVPALVSTFFGVNEPCLYGVLVPRKKVMWASFIASGVGAAIAGFCGAKLWSFGPNGILGLPCFINPAGIDMGFIGLALGGVATFVIAMIATLYLGADKDPATVKGDR